MRRPNFIHRTLVGLLATASLLPSSWVFCVEASGDVKVERSTGSCCVIGVASSAAVASPSADECDGCSDIGLECSALRKERFEDTSSIVLAAARVMPAPSTVLLETPAFARPEPGCRFTSAHLSSVVIRC